MRATLWALGCLLLLGPETAFARTPRPAPKPAAKPGTGSLQFTSMTDEIKVYLDGVFIGKTPFAKPVPVKAGKHKLKATKPGYSTLEAEVLIRAGRTEEFPLDLMPFSGLVKFAANIEGAEVYVDNNLVGHIPLVQEVSIGDHKVQIVKEGYEDFTATINVKAGEKHFIEANLAPFKDFSPEVLAMAAAAKEKEEADKRAAAEMLRAESAPPPPPAWYEGLHRKWWFWTAVGVAAVTAVAVPVALSAGGGASPLDRHTQGPHAVIDLARPGP